VEPGIRDIALVKEAIDLKEMFGEKEFFREKRINSQCREIKDNT